ADPRKGGAVVGVVPFEQFLGILRDPGGVRFVAQPQLGYDERWTGADGVVHTATDEQREANVAIEAAFRPFAALDRARVGLGLSRPDLVEIVPPDDAHPLPRLRVWDFKASREPRHEHFIQVAWYAFLLDAVLESQGITSVAVDHEVGAIRSYQAVRDDTGVLVPADPSFDLAPYRLAVEDFLRQRVSSLLDVAADRAHYHVCDACLSCEHVQRCREQADASHDVCRLAYLSSDGKRQFAEAGLGTHHDLAVLAAGVATDEPGAQDVADALRARSHDLHVHLGRYLALAEALEDGVERWLGRPSLLIPRFETVRVVISAERDAVTHRCFALGFRTFAWEGNRAATDEHVYVSEREGDEALLLERFLTDLFARLEGYDAHNRAVDGAPIPEDAHVEEAIQAYDALKAQKEVLEAEKATLGTARDAQTSARRQQFTAEIKAFGGPRSGKLGEASKVINEARRVATFARLRRKVSVQLYAYDALDVRILAEAVERHLFDPATPAPLYAALRNLARLVPPSSVLPDPGTFRSLPVVVVQEALRNHVALPVPYAYDLRTVSERFRKQAPDGSERGTVFTAPYGFQWDFSNQLAFERIHDVWRGRDFVHGTTRADGATRTGAVVRNREMSYSPAAIRATLEEGVRSKLRATNSVVAHLREQMRRRDELLFYKEPFALYGDFDPAAPVDGGAARLLDALHVFTVLEESYDEMRTKTLHTAPPEERAARNEAIHGLTFVGRAAEDFSPNPNGPLLAFTYSPAAREARIGEGEMGVVLTDASNPLHLLVDVDGPLFRSGTRPGAAASVEVVRVRPGGDPPRLWLRVGDPGRLAAKLRGVDGKLDPADLDAELAGRTFVLDRTYSDYNSPRVVACLKRLRSAAERRDPDAAHVLALIETGWNDVWTPTLEGGPAYDALQDLARAVRDEAGRPLLGEDQDLLNEGQRRAYDRSFLAPLGLVWGPPGTGKSHALAHFLLARALAARAAGVPQRLLVTAFTHHAIVNVLARTARLAKLYGLDDDVVRFAKVLSSTGHAADAGLPLHVHKVAATPRGRENLLHDLEHTTGALVVGATVWGATALADTWRDANRPTAPEGEAADVPPEPAVAPLFDGVLVDEASQMKLPDALLAFCTLRSGGAVLLAGDDQQLPPIIQGTYPKEAAPYLTSVFAFMRHRMQQRLAAGQADAEARTLFLLDENFRMNEPLTAYPREVIYGTFRSRQPLIRATLVDAPPGEAADGPLLDTLLDPDRPVVFVRYTPPRAYTARNPVEAALAARLVERLAARLVDPRTGAHYTPEAFAQEGVAVVAPHRAQNAAIRAELADRGFGPDETGHVTRPMPLVDTVDKAQGQEFDVVVVSYGVADEAYAEAES
ncbi:MAG TPA: AAA domain-containing protein, partial [Rhodothermales bacterium]|nr:AAA domain-containing protein [Rhodothermales bacterium]